MRLSSELIIGAFLFHHPLVEKDQGQEGRRWEPKTQPLFYSPCQKSPAQAPKSSFFLGNSAPWIVFQGAVWGQEQGMLQQCQYNWRIKARKVRDRLLGNWSTIYLLLTAQCTLKAKKFHFNIKKKKKKKEQTLILKHFAQCILTCLCYCPRCPFSWDSGHVGFCFSTSQCPSAFLCASHLQPAV